MVHAAKDKSIWYNPHPAGVNIYLICINFIDSTLYGVNTSKEKLKYEGKSACDNFTASITFLQIIYFIICQKKYDFAFPYCEMWGTTYEIDEIGLA